MLDRAPENPDILQLSWGGRLQAIGQPSGLTSAAKDRTCRAYGAYIYIYIDKSCRHHTCDMYIYV